MTNSTFDWIMAAICIVCAVLLLSGHGDGLMEMFGSTSRQNSMKVEKKKSKEEKLKYQRAIGAYCALLAACEIVLALFGDAGKIIPIAAIAVAVIGIIIVTIYIRRQS